MNDSHVHATFDNYLLQPQYSDIESRSQIDISVKLPKGFKFSNPFIPANMKSTVGQEMIGFTSSNKSLSILHRFMSFEDQLSILKANKDKLNYLGFSVGVKNEDYLNVSDLVENGAKIICIDIAHAHSAMAGKMCEFISKKFPLVLLIAGNVATSMGAKYLWDCGADIVKVGIGASGICSTRLEAGAGVPQLSAIINVYKQKLLSELELDKDLAFISDGGIRIPADANKALCFADMIMAGNIFAGTDEAPGDIVSINGVMHKKYVGSSTHKESRKEGVEAFVPYKGPVQNVFTRFCEGLQSSCSYSGVRNLEKLKKYAKLIKISDASIVESGIHDVKVIK